MKTWLTSYQHHCPCFHCGMWPQKFEDGVVRAGSPVLQAPPSTTAEILSLQRQWGRKGVQSWGGNWGKAGPGFAGADWGCPVGIVQANPQRASPSNGGARRTTCEEKEGADAIHRPPKLETAASHSFAFRVASAGGVFCSVDAGISEGWSKQLANG